MQVEGDVTAAADGRDLAHRFHDEAEGRKRVDIGRKRTVKVDDVPLPERHSALMIPEIVADHEAAIVSERP
ncbi:MAG: hypothetical protein M3322_07595 [Actinomycetota bacterium]|nr:hypothetical protein [Actinomycetota bacterium]